MTGVIYRNPVPGSPMKRPLACIGARTTGVCRDRFMKLGVGASFVCLEGCASGSFCFPRQRRTSTFYHYHQGIDLSIPEADKTTGLKSKHGSPIVSVTAGEVVHFNLTDNEGYGIAIMIESDVPGYGKLYFFYAHCQELLSGVKVGMKVAEQQEIAKVGSTGNAGWLAPHLHFEVRRSARLPKQHDPETETSFENEGLRLDPLKVLESLGPWGMRDLFVPTQTIPATSENLQVELEKVEMSSKGGYYPLGANNTWHGGVHLATLTRPLIRAPFDAKIVALRLDSDPAKSMTAAGSTNFILLRHEISEPAARLLAGKPLVDPPDPKDPKGKLIPNAVGRGSQNAGEPVRQAKAALHGRFDGALHPFYAPADASRLIDEAADEELFSAIEAFQDTLPRPKKMKKKHPWPDGVMTVGGYTWTALFGPTKEMSGGSPADATLDGADEGPIGGDVPTPVKPASDPRRTLYCLLMHLGPQGLNAEVAKSFPWLAGAKVPPRAGNEDDELLHEQLERQRLDEEEAKRGITGRVGFPSAAPDVAATDTEPGAAGDIEWVQQRLIRFGFFDGPPTGTWTESLRDAIAAFQREHTDYYAAATGREAPGYVSPDTKTKGKTVKSETLKALKKTEAQLAGSGAKQQGIDPLFAARVSERGTLGTSAVVSGLDIAVRSGDPLWVSGRAQGYDGPEHTTMYEQIHWELFSEHPLVDWDQLVGDNDDLQVDMPDALFEIVEQHEIPGFEKNKWLVPAEIMEFYSQPRSKFLRRTACRFRSEWALDTAKWITDLRKFGFDVDNLADELQPFAIWEDAKDVLPASTHVWHYNPIELLGRYAELLESLQPKPLVPKGACSLTIRVIYADGQPWSGARVRLAYFATDAVDLETDVLGVVKLSTITAGAGIVWINEEATAAQFFELDAGESEEVTLIAPIIGSKTTGTLSVLVLGLDDCGKPDAPVLIEGDGWSTESRTDGEGRCTVELIPGIYDVTAEHASESVDILANGVREIVLQCGDTGALRVEVRFGDGTPASGVDVVVDDGTVVGSTNPGGIVEFARVPSGLRRVFVPGQPSASTNVEIATGDRRQVDLRILLPSGAIDVFVTDANGFPCADVDVVLRTESYAELATGTSDGAGLVCFEDVTPGTYAVSADNGARDELGVRVLPDERTAIAVKLVPEQTKAPAAKGKLQVTVVYTDGADVVGTVKVAKKAGGLASSKQLSGGEHGAAAFEIPADRYRVYLDGYDDHAVDVDLPAGGTVPVVLLLPA